jgi:hypothetical protein
VWTADKLIATSIVQPFRSDVIDFDSQPRCWAGSALTEYRDARSSEQMRVAEELRELYSTAGVLLVDAQGHGIISAKIASTVHDAIHALLLSELDHREKRQPGYLEGSICDSRNR